MAKFKEYKQEFFECDCHSPYHVIAVSRAEDGLYITVQLKQWRPLWKRIWMAFQYVFKIKECDDHWDSWLLAPEDVERFKLQFDNLEEDMERWRKHWAHEYDKIEDVDRALDAIFQQEEVLEERRDNLLEIKDKLEREVSNG